MTSYALALGIVASLVGAGAAYSAQGAAQGNASQPDFSPDNITGWVALNYGDRFVQPPSGAGPVTDDPAYPFVSNQASAATGQQPTFHISDLNNPILQPWAKDELRKRNEHILSGKPGYSTQASCLPLGVPAFVLHPVQPLYFIQSTKMVLMINQENLDVRRIYLNVPHSAPVIPSWFGESVGHYEGDTLVVDTIGMNDKTYIDNFRTPHTNKLHVVERFRMIDGGNALEANVHVEDMGAFTAPWNAIQRWRRVEQGPMFERICSENPANHFNHDMEPIPQDDTPDF